MDPPTSTGSAYEFLHLDEYMEFYSGLLNVLFFVCLMLLWNDQMCHWSCSHFTPENWTFSYISADSALKEQSLLKFLILQVSFFKVLLKEHWWQEERASTDTI